MEIKLSVDRIEGGIAVCYSDKKKYELPADGLREGLIILASFDGDGNLSSITPLESETAKERTAMSERTKALFRRNKK